MKKQTKGIIFTVLFGGGLLFWATAASLPGQMAPNDELIDEQNITITGTPADNFPDDERPSRCGTGSLGSNAFVKEYKIPTECTQPLAITTDPNGNVWFAQTNTGNLAMFDPKTEKFTEFENPTWPEGRNSMMWGMNYSPDGNIIFTDSQHAALWKFSPQDEQYQALSIPNSESSLIQKVDVKGSQAIMNDFSGGRLMLLDLIGDGEQTRYLSLPSPIENAFTSDFAIDSENNLWYTNWLFPQGGGVLVKIDQKAFDFVDMNKNETIPLNETTKIFQFPAGMNIVNGVEVGMDNKIWIAETGSSFFFSFDPQTESFTKYLTTDPPHNTYGNFTGVIKTPDSKPYWIESDQKGNLVFNEQTANRIAIFNPTQESLVEYSIPSKNPNWADCGSQTNCGIAQVFDFTINDDKIWFTEWVENNIGVIDTSIPLPFAVEIDDSDITLKKGNEASLILTVTPQTNSDIPLVQLVTADTSDFSDLIVETEIDKFQLDFDEPRIIKVNISASDSALTSSHKVIIGAQTDEVAVSKYLTVNIEP